MSIDTGKQLIALFLQTLNSSFFSLKNKLTFFFIQLRLFTIL